MNENFLQLYLHTVLSYRKYFNSSNDFQYTNGRE